MSKFQNYKYMAVDDEIFDLTNFYLLSDTALEVFGDKCVVTNFYEVNSP